MTWITTDDNKSKDTHPVHKVLQVKALRKPNHVPYETNLRRIMLGSDYLK